MRGSVSAGCFGEDRVNVREVLKQKGHVRESAIR